MKVDTWNSFHPLDEERFHKALKQVFSKLGTKIDEETFEEVILTLFDDLYPNWEPKDKCLLIELYSKKSANIASYLYDTV